MSTLPIDLADVRLRRHVERLHRLGPRATYELLAEIGREHLLRVDIEQRAARYAGLDPKVLRALGGDEL
jgi:hypothetical protein